MEVAMPSEVKSQTLRAGIYARYSSNNQSAASIDDQVRICRAEIERNGWGLVEVYTDPALSGASTFRPGYQKLLLDASAGALDVLVAESLDRLSRDLADVATLYKHLSFSGVPLWTVAEGQINELHVGLKGTMNALYLKDLAEKTHRGQEGRVRSGMSAGGICYGYELVSGRPGVLRIEAAKAPVVVRIFEERAAGRSPGRSPWGSARTAYPGLGVATPRFAATSPVARASSITSCMSAGGCGTGSASSKTRRPVGAGPVGTTPSASS
jgi:DNA invertase Pin-like site-specific DNA recombinase